MGFTVNEVLDFVRENDVKFIRLTFCNLFGVQKNIAIMAPELPGAFERGICVDAASVAGFLTETDADLFLFPDPATLSILPWRPSHGRVVRLFCDIRRADGSPCPGDGRALLRRTEHTLATRGLECRIGCEYEFYLFTLDDDGNPTRQPQDSAGYCDVAPLDRGENVRREICLALEEMNLRPESSHHERGPGQNEVVAHPAGALEAADMLVTFRAVTGVIAARNGLSACFLPKPLPDRDGSSVHINLSLLRDGGPIFRAVDGGHNAEAESFMAGIMHHLPDLSLFLNPLPSSYARFGDDVPRAITYGRQNRNQLIRVPATTGGGARMELRSPDPSLSPYFAFSLLLEAGLWGIDHRAPLVRDQSEADAPRMPADLGEAVRRAGASELVRAVIPPEALTAYADHKLSEYQGLPTPPPQEPEPRT